MQRVGGLVLLSLKLGGYTGFLCVLGLASDFVNRSVVYVVLLLVERLLLCLVRVEILRSDAFTVANWTVRDGLINELIAQARLLLLARYLLDRSRVGSVTDIFNGLIFPPRSKSRASRILHIGCSCYVIGAETFASWLVAVDL